MPISKESSQEAVKAYQGALLVLGYNVGKSGADGFFGKNTIGATHDFCEDHNLPLIEGAVVPDELVNRVLALAETRRNAVVKKPAKLLDLTMVSHPGPRRELLTWQDVKGGVLHNTGCPLPDPSQAEIDYFLEYESINLKNTPALCRWAKHHADTLADGTKVYQSLKAHYGITYSGWILNIHPLNVRVHHGHALRGIGYEVAGFMLGIEDDPTTERDETDLKTRASGADSWKIQSVTEAQIESMHELVAYDIATVAQHGGKYESFDAHRWGAPEHSRRGDCGSKMWKRIGLSVIKKHGLIVRPVGYTAGKSIDPCPEAWDERCKGVKY